MYTTTNTTHHLTMEDRLWQRDQMARIVAHTSDSSAGAGIRLLVHIALNATPARPWVSVNGTRAGAMLKNGHSSSASRTIQRLIEQGYIRRQKPTRHNETPTLRLATTCNALCHNGDHVQDAICHAALEWLNLTNQELEERLESLPDPTVSAQYRTALLDCMRLERPPQAIEAEDTDAAEWLTRNGLLRPVGVGFGTMRVIPHQGR